MSNRGRGRGGPKKPARVRFSVVIPLYNKVPFIAETLETVVSQTHHAAEIICVDDGSTDGGADLVAERFPSVQVIRQRNAGVGAARNTGLQNASEEWVALLDADDRWFPGHLAELAALIEAVPDARLVSTDHREVTDPEGMVVPPGDTPTRRRIAYFLEASEKIGVVWSSAVALHRDTALELGGFGPWPAGEDLEFWARMALHHPVAHSSAVTALYVRNASGTMQRLQAEHRTSPSRRIVSPAAVSPSAATVASALQRDDHVVPPNHLSTYLDSRVTSAMRQRIVAGDAPGARELRGLLHRPLRKDTLVPLGLSLLPAPLLRMLLGLRDRVSRHGKAAADGHDRPADG
jgi:hypothetical protein